MISHGDLNAEVIKYIYKLPITFVPDFKALRRDIRGLSMASLPHIRELPISSPPSFPVQGNRACSGVVNLSVPD